MPKGLCIAAIAVRKGLQKDRKLLVSTNAIQMNAIRCKLPSKLPRHKQHLAGPAGTNTKNQKLFYSCQAAAATATATATANSSALEVEEEPQEGSSSSAASFTWTNEQ